MPVFVKLFPYLLALAFGFFLATALYGRRQVDSATDWESKFRAVEEKYRALTKRLEEFDQGHDVRANRLRRTLWDVRGILANPETVSPDRIRVALEEIEFALEETASPEEPEPSGGS